MQLFATLHWYDFVIYISYLFFLAVTSDKLFSELCKHLWWPYRKMCFQWTTHSFLSVCYLTKQIMMFCLWSRNHIYSQWLSWKNPQCYIKNNTNLMSAGWEQQPVIFPVCSTSSLTETQMGRQWQEDLLASCRGRPPWKQIDRMCFAC